MSTISIRFATNDIRDLSDGALPVEVWTVRTSADGTTQEDHAGTPTMRHTIARHVKRAAAGHRFGWTKHVEIRTPKARTGGGAMTGHQRAIWLACQAANDAQLGACYREQAGGLLLQAFQADPEGEWSVDEDGHMPPTGLPEDWMGIAELDEAAALVALEKVDAEGLAYFTAMTATGPTP